MLLPLSKRKKTITVKDVESVVAKIARIPPKSVSTDDKATLLNIEQDLLISKILPTKRTMIKDEDVCLHCGLCAERCPTGAWDMQTFLYEEAKVYS